MPKLTEDQKANYLREGGGECPACGSVNMQCDNVQIDGPSAWQECNCVDCGKSWRDVYKLIDVEDAN